MNRLWVIGIIIGIVALAGAAYYLTTGKIANSAKTYRIGILVRGSGYDAAVAGFKKRMDELGYHDGKNVTYDVQLISDKNQLAVVAKKFIKDGADLIHTYSTPATEAAIQATKDAGTPVPIVFGSVGDPLLLHDVTSISHPG